MGGTFNSLTIEGNDGAWGADNFVLGQQTAAVPEPSSLALFGIGACVACAGAARRYRRWEHKGSATVLNNVNDRFEKRFSNSNFVQCIDRDVRFFEAWVSVFDGGLNWDYRLSILALTGETECGTV